jgi:pimeloyl-ACP methyl ester carboxylesterase
VRFAPANTQPFNAGPFADDGALAHAQYDPRVSAIQRAAGLAYRSAGDSTDRVALLVHGVPESSYMWRDVLPALAGAGWRAIAPDLHGFGDSPPDPPGTWERHVEALERFVQELGLGPVAHDWGVMIGLRWACDHPGSVRALAISDGGFFADREWHDMAKAMRTPEVGEQLVGSVTRESLGAMLNGLSIGITDDALDEYWKAYADETARLGILELYRSGDFEARTLRGPRRGDGRAGARRVGSAGPICRRRVRPPLPRGAARLGARHLRWRRALRVGGRA